MTQVETKPLPDLLVEDHFVYYLFFPETPGVQEWLIKRGLTESKYFEGFFQLIPAAYDTVAEAQRIGLTME